MKLPIINPKGETQGKAEVSFSEDYRPDLIQRAVLSVQSKNRQKYGKKPRAGMRHSAELSRRRRKYRGAYGKGISRVPRKILTRRGTQMYWVGANAPGTVGGRKAHAPNSQKNWEKMINKKEYAKALRCAVSATLDKDIVEARGHHLPDTYPFILSHDFENIAAVKDLKTALLKLGFEQELDRPTKRTRAGKGKRRGRKNRTGVSLLLIVSQGAPLLRADNLPGVDIVTPEELNAEHLAPGTHAGRATLFTEKALQEAEERL